MHDAPAPHMFRGLRSVPAPFSDPVWMSTRRAVLLAASPVLALAAGGPGVPGEEP